MSPKLKFILRCFICQLPLVTNVKRFDFIDKNHFFPRVLRPRLTTNPSRLSLESSASFPKTNPPKQPKQRTFVLNGQLLDPPHQRPERLLILGHARTRLHDRALLLTLVHHEPVQALDLAELVLGRVHRPVPEHLLHAEHVHLLNYRLRV